MRFLFWVLLAAGTDPQAPLPEADSRQGPEPLQPSLELLEFLGSFETIDGDWLDPMSFEEQYESESRTQDNETDHDEIDNRDPDPDAVQRH